jgi:hypothetical protein
MIMKSLPPQWADKFLQLYCHPDVIEDIQGDLYELYYYRLMKEGKFWADLKFIWEVVRFFRWGNVRNPMTKFRLSDMFVNRGKMPDLWEGEYRITSEWNNMLFENRNKLYGAYVVRSDYSRNLLTGFLAGLLFVPCVFGMFWFILDSYW